MNTKPESLPNSCRKPLKDKQNMANPTILSCPVCTTQWQGSPKTLYCSQCQRNHVAGPSRFFDFKIEASPLCKGLRVNMDFDYVKEGSFSTFLSESVLRDIDASISNLPGKLSHLYFSLHWACGLNRLVKNMIHSVSKNNCLGANMTAVFKKTAT